LQITARAQSLHRVDGSSASTAVNAAEEQWAERLPPDPDTLFAWCLDQPQDLLLELLAYCAAQTVNATVLRHESEDTVRMRDASRLAEAVKLDMTAWFQPTAANYFSKINKTQILEALREIKGAAAPAWAGMKKAELAALAERTVAGTGWLPAPLRAPVPVTASEA
jgi:ParB family chromosome partitioning protein